MKKLPVKKGAKKVAKKAIKKLPKPKVKVAERGLNRPPIANKDEIALCMAGNWRKAAEAHNDRTGVKFRRSLVAIAEVYRDRLQEVLAQIKAELKAGR